MESGDRTGDAVDDHFGIFGHDVICCWNHRGRYLQKKYSGVK